MFLVELEQVLPDGGMTESGEVSGAELRKSACWISRTFEELFESPDILVEVLLMLTVDRVHLLLDAGLAEERMREELRESVKRTINRLVLAVEVKVRLEGTRVSVR